MIEWLKKYPIAWFTGKYHYGCGGTWYLVPETNRLWSHDEMCDRCAEIVRVSHT